MKLTKDIFVAPTPVLFTTVCYSQLFVIIERVSCCSVGIPIDILNSYVNLF